MFTSIFSQEVQKVFDDAESKAGQIGGPFPSPADWRDQMIYFIMVDRFNNPISPPRHIPFDDPNYFDYQGGTFAGIQQQLGYIKSLGAGALWLSPVLKNLPWDGGSYHGYGIHDFIRANPKFASNPNKADDELRSLVDAAHQNGLYVIFDIVLNHTGDVFAYNGASTANFSSTRMPVAWRDETGKVIAQNTDVGSIQNPSVDSVVWPSELQNQSFFRCQGNANGPDDTIGDFQSLKQFLTDNTDVQRFLIRAYQYVIARYDVDGFRIDTIRYLKKNFAQLFGNSVREYALVLGKKNFFTFGEVLDGNTEQDISKFVGKDTTFGNDPNSLVGVDAALDYPLFSALGPALKGFGAPSAITGMYNFRKQAEKFILSSHGDASRYFVTFLDNHDRKRRFRFEQPGNPTQFDDQVSMGVACLYCLPGIPCIYYGTEQGLHGMTTDDGPDPAVREALWGITPGFPRTTSFYVEMQKIFGVRNAEPALRYGRFYFRPLSGDGINFGVSTFLNGVLAWSRILNDEEVIIVANSDTANVNPVDVILERTLSASGQNLRVLYSNKKNFIPPSAIRTIQQATVIEIDGSTSNGSLNAAHITLQPMEVQILRI
jgi:glycosidase